MPSRSPNPESLLVHAAFVRRLARRLVRDESRAEDLTQEVWKRALEALGPVDDLRAWLGGVVRNTWRQNRRREQRELRHADANSLLGEEPSTEAALLRVEQVRGLVDAIETLSEPLRVVIVLRYYDDLKPREIARRLDLPVETVKSRLKRGLAKLRQELDEKWERDRWTRALLPLALTQAKSYTTALWMGVTAVLISSGMTAFFWERAPKSPNPSPTKTDRTAVVESNHHDPDIDGERKSVSVVERVETSPSDFSESVLRPIHLIDSKTGRPLTEYEIRAGERTLITDEQGRVELPVDSPEWLAIDHPSHNEAKPLSLADSDRSSRISLETGPILQIELLGQTLDDRDIESRLSVSDPRIDPRSFFTPLRGSIYRWVRFAARANELRGLGPFRLEIRSKDGYAFGEVELQTLESTPVRVDMRLTGVVRGSISGTRGQSVSEAKLTLLPIGANTDRGRLSATDEDGRFRIPWVALGLYTLQAETPRHRTARVTVAVHEGQAAIAPLELSEAVDLVEVKAALEFNVHVPLSETFVVLTSLRPPLQVYSLAISPGDVESSPYEVSFPGVPKGSYTLSIHSEDFFPWSPASIDITAPHQDLLLYRRDDIPVESLTFEVMEPWPTDLDVFIEVGGQSKVQSLESGSLTLENVPVGIPLQWIARAGGCVPLRGTRDDFDGRIARLSFEKGWGNRFLAQDPEGHPIPGVPVRLDGEIVGITDDSGQLTVNRGRAPSHVEVPDPGWEIHGGDVIQGESGTRFRDLIWGVELILVPRDSKKGSPK